jgi:hypothetical protein
MPPESVVGGREKLIIGMSRINGEYSGSQCFFYSFILPSFFLSFT